MCFRYEGNLAENPYVFGRTFNRKDPQNSFGIHKVNFTLAGEIVEGLALDDVDTFKDHFHRLTWLLKQQDGTNPPPLIDWENFLRNNMILMYDLTAKLNREADNLLPLVRGGNIRVEVILDKPGAVSLNMLSFIEVPSLLEIDKAGKVSLNKM